MSKAFSARHLRQKPQLHGPVFCSEMEIVIGLLSLGAPRILHIRHNPTKKDKLLCEPWHIHHHGWDYAAILKA